MPRDLGRHSDPHENRRVQARGRDGHLQPPPPRADALEAAEPRLVVEVLSKYNTGLAWQRKLEEYRRREGLKYILLIESREPKATLLTRTATEWEPFDADEMADVFDLSEIGCRLPMRDIYEGLTFEAA